MSAGGPLAVLNAEVYDDGMRAAYHQHQHHQHQHQQHQNQLHQLQDQLQNQLHQQPQYQQQDQPQYQQQNQPQYQQQNQQQYQHQAQHQLHNIPPSPASSHPRAASTASASSATLSTSSSKTMTPIMNHPVIAEGSAAAPAPATNPKEKTSKKRSKPQSSSDDEEKEVVEKKRPRGRPRLNPKDESAAERRRTQIRLAQRAYRTRKETTINTLEKKVEDLRTANEGMVKAFMQLQQFSVGKGLVGNDAGFAEVLQSATKKFLELAELQEEQELDALESSSPSPRQDKGKQKAYTSSSDTSDEGPERVPRPAYPVAANQQQFVPTVSASIMMTATTMAAAPMPPPHTYSYLPPSHTTHISQPPYQPPALSAAPAFEAAPAPEWPVAYDDTPFPYPETVYEVVAEPTLDNASFPMCLPFDDTDEVTEIENMHASSPEPAVFTAVPHRWGYDLWKKLPTPIGYPHHERTFGRRLHRAGVELGLSLVTNPDPPPHIYASVFGFCLLFESREAIIARLQTMLGKPTDETFNNWRVPFVRLGGAGTHGLEAGKGASQGRYGNQGLRDDEHPQHETGFSMGPFNSVIENTRQNSIDCRMRMIMPGFQGDFFDPEDIELYLRNRGVNIPGNADYVEADIEVEDFTDGDVPAQTTPYEGRTPKRTEMYDQAVTGALYMMNGPPLDPPSGPATTAARGAGVEIPPYGTGSRRRRVIVNVEVLINEINFRSVCLGRAPGTRSRDINVAFWRSITLKD